MAHLLSADHAAPLLQSWVNTHPQMRAAMRLVRQAALSVQGLPREEQGSLIEAISALEGLSQLLRLRWPWQLQAGEALRPCAEDVR